jgi:hypothetical protein
MNWSTGITITVIWMRQAESTEYNLLTVLRLVLKNTSASVGAAWVKGFLVIVVWMEVVTKVRKGAL